MNPPVRGGPQIACPTDCAECALAQASAWHCIYLAGCPGCEIRAVGNAPKRFRERFLERFADPAEREQKRVQIVAEYHRRKALERAA
jgi:hypothetical protein